MLNAIDFMVIRYLGIPVEESVSIDFRLDVSITVTMNENSYFQRNGIGIRKIHRPYEI